MQVGIIDQAAEQADSAAELVSRYVDLGRDGMVGSKYSRGCAIAPLVIEGAAGDAAEVGESTRRAFSAMTDRLAFHLVVLGVEQEAAGVLAEATIAGVEGAMVISRAGHTPGPFDAANAVLTG